MMIATREVHVTMISVLKVCVLIYQLLSVHQEMVVAHLDVILQQILTANKDQRHTALTILIVPPHSHV